MPRGGGEAREPGAAGGPDAAGAQGAGTTGLDAGVPPEGETFDASYRSGTPPWDIGRPQTALAELAASGAWRGRVLDAGCGTGEHALLAAALGLEVTGIDAAPTAIRLARDKARARGLDARFELWDALELPSLGERYDTVIDCGLFHVFDDEARARYVRALSAVVEPGGHLMLLCFSDEQEGDWGPRRVRAEELRSAFAPGWDVERLEGAVLEITMPPHEAKGWLAVLRRR
ncbi:MAG TPA: class I SAM-dependent methyltransferase [Acidimicrobiales bacterium]|nr:class I SAM-dependent methyltransferase [Acidimicrobiales bacterium]